MNTIYRPIRPLVVGGKAEVILASRHTAGGPDRLVVIKRAAPHLREDHEFIQMFLDQARLVSALRHPGIADVLDVYPEGDSFAIAMTYVSGEDVRYIADRSRSGEIVLPVPVTCHVIASVAAALDYIHTAADDEGRPMGIIHRDVVPSSIMIGYDGTAKMVDFGIAGANFANIYAKPSALKGRYAYMSPEQLAREDLDARSDIFSLGIILYELLTARRLFKGASESAVLQAVVNQQPPPPSEVNPEVPAELDAAVLKMLAKEPDARTSTAAEVRDQLEHAVELLGGMQQLQLAEWMQSNLKARHKQRQQLEREVMIRAREGAVPGEGTASTSAPLGTHPGISASFKDSGMSQAPSRWSPPPKRTRWPLIVLGILLGGAGAIAMIWALLVTGFKLGQDDPPPADWAPAPAEQIVSSSGGPVTLVVHSVPGGATLFVNGMQQEDELGPDGVMVPSEAGASVALHVTKDGYQSHERTVTAPERGAKHVHISLSREDTAEEGAEGDEATAAQEEEADDSDTKPRRPQAVPSRRATRRTARRSARRPTRRVARPSDPASGSLLIAFDPPNAGVWVDGARHSGTSPLLISDLSAGRHTANLRAAGYDAISRTVDVRPGSETKLNLRLQARQPDTAILDIYSAPSGASVSVNGVPKGRTPIVGLPSSADKPQAIVVKLPGYKAWSTQLAPSPGKNPAVIATLEADGAAVAPVAVAPVRDVTVPRSAVGDPARGKEVFRSGCNSCHGKSAIKLRPQRYTRRQWHAYFASQRHSSKALWKDTFSRADLAAVKGYMLTRAADVESATAAGVR